MEIPIPMTNPPLPVEPVLRAFDVLAALNLRPLSRIRDLHTATGLPNPWASIYGEPISRMN